ncbi:MAG: lantibiotic immunity ABC transporter MutE/EpiE family permease subunit [Dorea sp.]|jgi:lantibiotic protection ABC transporter MutE/EpiE family permease subunit|nr:lantibiotic immunity ABC transporter MutE/EpiE family permease subunit [Dorea sp.]
MLRLFKAEVIKNSHTAAAKTVVFMPVLVVLLSVFLAREYFLVDVLNWWYIALLPGVLAVIGSGVCRKEKKTENRNILTLPVDVKKVWDAKVLCTVRLLVFSGIVMTGLAMLMRNIVKYGMHVEYVLDIDNKTLITAMVILTITFLWQIPFCMLLDQLVGTLFMIVIHMLLYVVSASILSLEPYFMIFPGAIPARLMCVVLKVLPNGLLAKEGMATFALELLDERMMGAGILSALFWFILLWFLSRKIYERRVFGK